MISVASTDRMRTTVSKQVPATTGGAKNAMVSMVTGSATAFSGCTATQ